MSGSSVHRTTRPACYHVPGIDLRENLEVCLALYRHTLGRHQATEIYHFAPAYFRVLAEMPAVTALARHEGVIVAIILWVRNGDVVLCTSRRQIAGRLSHLCHLRPDRRAERTLRRLSLIHLGGAAGLEPEKRNGLAHFKRGLPIAR